MALIRRLCVEEGAGADLAEKLKENLKEILSDNKVCCRLARPCAVFLSSSTSGTGRRLELTR